MKKFFIFVLSLLISVNLFADDFFPSLKNKTDAGNNFSISYSSAGKSPYLKVLYKGLSDNTEILAAKTGNGKMELIVRYRQLHETMEHPTNFVDYYLISIEKNGSASSKKIEGSPVFKDFYFFPATVNDNKVNFRDGPNTKAKVAGQFQKDAKINFVGKVDSFMKIGQDSDFWYCFNFNGTEKWIFGRWITFPNSFALNKELFTAPQIFKTEEVVKVTSSGKIKNLPFENTTESVNRISSYKSGNSELQIIFDSDEYDYSAKIIKNNKVISSIEKIQKPVYSPNTKCLYYIKGGYSPTLHAVNIETGEAVSLVDKTEKYPQNEVYLEYECDYVLLLKENKLCYFRTVYGYDDEAGHPALDIIDLTTLKHTLIDFRCLRDQYGYDYPLTTFCMADENTVFTGLYNYYEDKTMIIVAYDISSVEPVWIGSLEYKGGYKDYYMLYNLGNKVILDNNYFGTFDNSFILALENNKFTAVPFKGGQVSNTFSYDNVEYLATVYAEKEYASSYTITIYELATGVEVVKKTFKPKNYLWGIRSIGVQNGKLLVEDIISK